MKIFQYFKNCLQKQTKNNNKCIVEGPYSSKQSDYLYLFTPPITFTCFTKVL